MKLEIHLPDSLRMDQSEARAFTQFLQRITNRCFVGSQRYGKIRPEQKYLSRLIEETRAYRRSGNSEQLLNIAVYAFLESYAPENRKAHFDPSIESVTRGKFGGAR